MTVQAGLLSLSWEATHTLSSGNYAGAVRDLFDALRSVAFTAGTGSGQIDREGSRAVAILASGNEDVDFAAGSFSDPFGSAVTFVKLKLLIIYNPSTMQTLTLKRAASNGLAGIFGDPSDTIAIKPGGVLVWYDPTGITVVPGTGDLLNVANNAGSSVTPLMYAAGTSA